MKRSEFIKSSLALPALLTLPLLVKGNKKTIQWSYEGFLEKDKTPIHLHFSKNPADIQKNYKDNMVDLCIEKNSLMQKLPFSIKSAGGINSFGKDFYWFGSANPAKPLKDEYSFLAQENLLTVGFKTENSKWYEAPIITHNAYILLKSSVIATLPYLDEYKDLPENCFLTSACVAHKGLDDDCYELTQLRQLREEFMRPQKIYSNLLQEYKVVAPQMLRKINVAENRDQILNTIYEQLVKPAVGFIEMGETEKAVLHYTRFVEQMKLLYL